MKKFIVISLASTIVATPALAQETPESLLTGRQSTVSVTPYAGYMFFGNLGDLDANTRLSNENSWVTGAQAKFRMNSQWSLVGNAAYARTNFRAVPASGGGTGSGSNISGDIGYWLGDVGVQWQLPFSMRNGSISPFVQTGVGAVRYSSNANSPSAEGSTTNAQFNAGVGLDIESGPLGIQLMLRDYVTSFDWNRVRAVDDNTDRSRIANNLALTAGLRINF